MGARGGANWLRPCAAIPDGLIGTFHRFNPSGSTIVVGSTQPLTEMSTGNISLEIKAAGP
jgi:hypothetical protein